jgi:glutaredoxin
VRDFLADFRLGLTFGTEVGGVLKDDRSACHITLYTKPECALCDEAKTALLALREELAFDIQEIDITTDAALSEAFGEEIPVGFLDGQKLFKYHVDPVLVRRQLLRRGGRSGVTNWVRRRP